MEFSELYVSVSGIVGKTRKEYYIKLWEKEYWDQEGMIVLYELLQSHPDLYEDRPKLYCYFKVKFRNYIKDVIRKQESQKRKFDRMVHEDIYSLSHMVSSGGMIHDELLMFRENLSRYRASLTDVELEQYHKLISGERFSGRQKMLRSMSKYFEDFR